MIPAAALKADFRDVAAFVSERTGLSFATIRPAFVEMGIRRAMGKAHASDLAAYLNKLRADETSFGALVSELTIGETYFFRETPQFDFIRSEILPAFRREHDLSTPLRSWCAGCASGEEPYSLAILFEQENFDGYAPILATDLSRAAIAKAKRGIYGTWSFRGRDPAFSGTYFKRSGDQFEIAERFRDRVAFGLFNLMAESRAAAADARGLDLILCRNVLIYFHRDAIARVARNLWESLAVGGWLITSASDPPLGELAPFATVVTDSGIYYRRDPVVRKQPPKFAPQEAPAPIPAAATTPVLPVARRPVSRPVATQQPRNPLAQAQAAFRKGEYRKALRFTMADDAGPELCEIRVRALCNIGESETAERTVTAAMAKYPLSAPLHFLYAMILLDFGRAEEALVAIRRVLYLDRSLAMAHLTLAAILERLGDSRRARRAYRSGQELLATLPPEESVPLSDGLTAGELLDGAARFSNAEDRP